MTLMRSGCSGRAMLNETTVRQQVPLKPRPENPEHKNGEKQSTSTIQRYMVLQSFHMFSAIFLCVMCLEKNLNLLYLAFNYSYTQG